MNCEEYKDFGQLIRACFLFAHNGDRAKAYDLITDYIEKSARPDSMFNLHDHKQALGFRVEFAEDKVAAEEEYIRLCEWMLNGATVSLMDSYARMAIYLFQSGQVEQAREYAKQCYRLSGFREDTSTFVIEAARLDRASRAAGDGAKSCEDE